MIGYTTIGTRDLERARQFYDAALVPLGGRRALNYQRSAYYGNPSRGAMLGITLPFDGEAASVGNGVMVALNATTRAEQDAGAAAERDGEGHQAHHHRGGDRRGEADGDPLVDDRAQPDADHHLG